MAIAAKCEKLKPTLMSNPFNFMNTTRFTLCILLAALVWTVGCSGLIHHSDPLVGWKPLFGRNYEKVDEAIKDDYQDYIQKLPLEEKNNVGPIFLFEDGTGQHAVQTSIPLNGTWWRHVLIYDKSNKRIKAIKYASGGYQS